MEAINLEILSVGPQFREVDYRRLEDYVKRAPFYRKAPMFQASMS